MHPAGVLMAPSLVAAPSTSRLPLEAGMAMVPSGVLAVRGIGLDDYFLLGRQGQRARGGERRCDKDPARMASHGNP